MTPIQQYNVHLQTGKIVSDPVQYQIVLCLDELFQELIDRQRFFSRFKRTLCKTVGITQTPVKGLYLWGGVGRGKTFLMDLFYHSLPFTQKARFHFHRFMHQVHQSLKQHQGKLNPLSIIASEFAFHSQIICFDEFYVSDIADAMILSELFQNLFSQGVTLVATSNLKPEDLYYNGLARDRFLPTIHLINKHTHVMHFGGGKDYRLQCLTHAQIYHYPLDEQADKNMEKYFYLLAADANSALKELTITERSVPVRALADNVVWFRFKDLCDSPRSTIDYIEIARCFHTVLLSEVKSMGPEKEDCARRFIALVDEFYERHVTLIISAEVVMTSLYHGQRFAFEFQRTISRLTEMQAVSYLSKPHLP